MLKKLKLNSSIRPTRPSRTNNQKDMTLKDELSRLEGVQYTTGGEWRSNSRKNEEKKPKRKQHPVLDMTGDGSKRSIL